MWKDYLQTLIASSAIYQKYVVIAQNKRYINVWIVPWNARYFQSSMKIIYVALPSYSIDTEDIEL